MYRRYIIQQTLHILLASHHNTLFLVLMEQASCVCDVIKEFSSTEVQSCTYLEQGRPQCVPPLDLSSFTSCERLQKSVAVSNFSSSFDIYTSYVVCSQKARVEYSASEEAGHRKVHSNSSLVSKSKASRVKSKHVSSVGPQVTKSGSCVNNDHHLKDNTHKQSSAHIPSQSSQSFCLVSAYHTLPPSSGDKGAVVLQAHKQVGWRREQQWKLYCRTLFFVT